jgi:peptidoglycan hydrolase CwlO-like protein
MSNSNKYQRLALRDHGFRTAGKTGGDAVAFLAELNSVFQGKIIDDSIDEIISEEERQKLQNQVGELQNEIVVLNERIQNSNQVISKKRDQKDQIEHEIDEINLGKTVNEKTNETFSWMKLSINLFFLLPLSIYLFLFYVATIYKVFYFNAVQIAESSTGTISALPAPGELSEALSYNYLLLFAPFLFFGFGYAVHVLLENKSRLKYLFVSLVLLVTFLLDFLMAYKIHKNTSDAELLISDSLPIPLFEDSNFYIILFMGFVVYIIWSILLNALINEWKKRDVIGKRKEMIDKIDQLIEEEEIKIGNFKAEIKLKEGNIRGLNEVINGLKIPVDKLKYCLSELNAGWLSFLTGSSTLSNVKMSCEDVYNNFLIENNLSK